MSETPGYDPPAPSVIGPIEDPTLQGTERSLTDEPKTSF
jgi:hypothetical protein